MDKYNYYDQILAKIYQNIMVEHDRDEGIYVNGYYDNYACKVYMKLVEAEGDITSTPIIMLMPLFSYIKFILRNWKVRKRYRWSIHFAQLMNEVTLVEDIAEFVAKYFGEEMTIYEDIYKEFYA